MTDLGENLKLERSGKKNLTFLLSNSNLLKYFLPTYMHMRIIFNAYERFLRGSTYDEGALTTA